MHRKLFFILVGMINFTLVYAQTAPIGLVPTIYNSGFAGEAGVPRIAAVSFLNTSYNIAGATTRYSNYISYDNFFKKIRSGVSITVGQETQYSRDDLPTSYVPRTEEYVATIGISPKFSFKGKYTIAPFVDFSISDFDKSSYYGYYSPGSEFHYQYTSVLTRAGLLMNSAKAYVGVSVTVSDAKIHEKMVNMPDYGNLKTFRATLQAGYTYQRFPDSDFSFTPQIAINWDRNSPMVNNIDFHDISLIGRYKKFIGGLNIPGVVVGYQNDRVKIMLSQWLFSLKNVYSGSVGVRYKLKSSQALPVPFK